MACPNYTVAPAQWGSPLSITTSDLTNNFGATGKGVKITNGSGGSLDVATPLWSPNQIVTTPLPSPAPFAGPYTITVSTLTDNCPQPLNIADAPITSPGQTTLPELAQQILALTQVLWEPMQPAGGEPLLLRVIPGTSLVPGNVLPSAVSVSFTVKYTVYRSDTSGTSTSTTQLTANKDYVLSPLAAILPNSDPLEALLILVPPFRDEFEAGTPVQFTVKVDLSVNLDGNPMDTVALPIVIPIPVMPIPIPGVAVISEKTNNNPLGAHLVMARDHSQMKDMPSVVAALGMFNSTLNSVAGALSGVADFASVLGAFTSGPLKTALDLIAQTPSDMFVVGGADDTEGLPDDRLEDNSTESMILIGSKGIKVGFYHDTGYDSGDKYGAFSADDDIGNAVGLTTGICVNVQTNLGYDDCESVRFE